MCSSFLVVFNADDQNFEGDSVSSPADICRINPQRLLCVGANYSFVCLCQRRFVNVLTIAVDVAYSTQLVLLWAPSNCASCHFCCWLELRSMNKQRLHDAALLPDQKPR